MSQANRIAYGAKRYQVITLNGELISTSGAMTGGGNPQRGKMGTQVIAFKSLNHPAQLKNFFSGALVADQNFLSLSFRFNVSMKLTLKLLNENFISKKKKPVCYLKKD